APHDSRTFHEMGYAEGALCSLFTKVPARKREAIGHCQAALDSIEIAVRGSKDPIKAGTDLVNRHSWLASAYLVNDDAAHAIAEFEVQDRLLDGLMRADPHSMTRKRLWIAFEREIAWSEATKMNRKGEALARLAKAASLADEMIRFEPKDANLKQLRSKIDDDVKEIEAMPNGKVMR